MEKKYKATLMNKDAETVALEGVLLYNDPENVPYYKITNATILDPKLCPPYIIEDRTTERTRKWFDNRMLAEERRKLRVAANWLTNSRKKSTLLPHFASLTDQYWIRYDKERLHYNEISFFKNTDISTTFGDVAFSRNVEEIARLQRQNRLNKLVFGYSTPDITTNGLQKKRWKYLSDRTPVLIKGVEDSTERDSMNEILVSRLLKKLKVIPFVEYDLYIEGYELCCACKDFVTEDTEFIPAWYLYDAISLTDEEKNMPTESRVYHHLMKTIEEYKIPDAKTFIDNMIIIDRMTLNLDRHLGNFGFIRNADTGKYLGCAPLFDFGNAFSPEEDYVGKKMELFGEREKELMKQKKIKPLEMDLIKEDLEQYPYMDDSQRDKVKENVKKNNEYIEREVQELNKVHKHKVKQAQKEI